MYICSMYSKELLKGTLSVIILNLLAENGRMYGYEISQRVKDLFRRKNLAQRRLIVPSLTENE